MIGQCPFATEIYKRMKIATQMRTQLIEVILRLDNNKRAKGTLLVAMFVIWRERCARIFRDINKSYRDLIEEVAQILHRHDDPPEEVLTIE